MIKITGRDAVEGTEGVANSFGIVGLPLEESSNVGTPSHVYDGSSEDTIVVASPVGQEAIGGCFLTYAYSYDVYYLAALSDGGGDRVDIGAPSH